MIKAIIENQNYKISSVRFGYAGGVKLRLFDARKDCNAFFSSTLLAYVAAVQQY